jgi:murein DD-endopeptidase MepM/ murein hydrolase activator NlpD
VTRLRGYVAVTIAAAAFLVAGSGSAAAISPVLPPAPSLPVPLPTPSATVPGAPSLPATIPAPALVPGQQQATPESDQQRQEYEQQQAQVQLQMPDYYAAYGAQALQLSSNDGPFTWPELSTSISQPFGCTDFLLEPSNPDCPTRHWHTGVDVVGPSGTPVFAAASGIARVFPGTVGYGNFVIIIHSDQYATLYGHLAGFTIRDGDTVHKGDVIGLEGSTGFSTGAHLHFEIRHGGDYVDPVPFFLPSTGGEPARSAPALERKSRQLRTW